MNTETKHFLAIFLGSATGVRRAAWDALPEDQRAEKGRAGVLAWHAWVEKHKAHIVEIGSPLGKTKSISERGIEDIRNDMGAFTVVRATSHAEAAKLFESHPHFAIFPGESIEVMECLPIPAAPKQ